MCRKSRNFKGLKDLDIDALTIDRGIPIPYCRKPQDSNSAKLREKLSKLKGTGSIFIPVKHKEASSIITAVYAQAKKAEIKVTIKSVKEGKSEGIRIWKA